MSPARPRLTLTRLEGRAVPALFGHVGIYPTRTDAAPGDGSGGADALAAVNLTGDGKPDIVAVNTDFQSLRVLVNDGAGRFGPPRTINAGVSRGDYPAIATADFNKDGKADVVVCGGLGPAGAQDNVGVLFGDGAGGFGSPLSLFAPVGGTIAVITADFNRDGNPDVAALGQFGDAAVLLGDGAGGFGPATTDPSGVTTTGIQVPRPGPPNPGPGLTGAMTAADFNGDGIPDLAVSCVSGLAVALGTGAAGSGPGSDYLPDAPPTGVAAADFNGDGNLDLATITANSTSGAAGSTSQFTVLLGDGAGNFAPQPPVAGGPAVANLIAADLNGDGHPDLVAPFRVEAAVAGELLAGITILTGDGAGGFARQDLITEPGTGDSRGSVAAAVADLTGGGTPAVIDGGDIANQLAVVTLSTTPGRETRVGFPQFAAGAGPGGAPVATLFNPDGSARLTQAVFDPSFTGGVRTAAADFNGDGVADLVAGTGPGGPTRVVILDGATGRELFSTQPFESAFTGGVYVAAGDLTGDGVPDLVVTPDEGGGPRVLVYDGTSFALAANFFGIDDPNFRGGARPAVGDLNGDGTDDLVVAAGFGGGPRVAVFDGSAVTTTRAKLCNDFFVFEQTLRNGVFAAVGDVDGDGMADVVAGGGPGGGPRVLVLSVRTLLAAGPDAAAAAPVANFFAGDTANRGGIRVAAKDLDGDDRADLVVGAGEGGGSRVTTYLGRGFSGGAAPAALAFDAFPGFAGGIFVG